MSVGESLARARAERGLSVEDVSSATRIRSSIVRDIESDTFDRCGGDVYARGHIRSIAHVVGIDPTPLVEEFDRGRGGTPVPVAPVAPYDPSVNERTERRRPNWAAAMIVALLAVIGYAGYAFVADSGSGPAKSARTAVGPSASATPTPTQASPTPSSGPALAQVTPDQATVLIRIIGDSSWVSVKGADGRLIFQGLMPHGATQVFRDPALLQLVIGNAPAVQMVVNNHDIGVPPSSGNVARLAVRKGDLTASPA